MWRRRRCSFLWMAFLIFTKKILQRNKEVNFALTAVGMRCDFPKGCTKSNSSKTNGNEKAVFYRKCVHSSLNTFFLLGWRSSHKLPKRIQLDSQVQWITFDFGGILLCDPCQRTTMRRHVPSKGIRAMAAGFL